MEKIKNEVIELKKKKENTKELKNLVQEENYLKAA